MTKITEKKLLAKATEVLSRPVGTRGSVAWIKGEMARTGNNRMAEVEDDKACKFCSLGALERAQFELGASSMTLGAARNRLSRVMDDTFGIADANDRPSTTFGQVLIAFDLAQTSAGDE